MTGLRPGYKYDKKTGAVKRINPVRSRIAKAAFKKRRVKHPTQATKTKIKKSNIRAHKLHKTESGRRTKYIM